MRVKGEVAVVKWLLRRIDLDGDCWVWNRSVTSAGYGHMGRSLNYVSVHRWIYERYVGSIPEGMQLHHTCFVQRCINPDHLTPVTPEEHRLLDRRR